MILLQVWDKEMIGKDEFMCVTHFLFFKLLFAPLAFFFLMARAYFFVRGEAKLRSSTFLDGNETWFPLEGREHKMDKVHGDVLLRFKLCYDK